MNSSSWRLEGVNGGDEQYPVESRFAVRHTPPDQQDPLSTVGGPFPPFCGTPHPSRSIGPHFDRRRSVSSILRYARPLPVNRTPFRT